MAAEQKPDRRPTPHGNTKRNKVIQHLRKHGPSTRTELPGDPTHTAARRFIGKLKTPSRRAGHSSIKKRPHPGKKKPPTIYYLYGDERRAVRRYIELNPRYVESCMNDNNSQLAQNLDRIIWKMFCEEWVWGDYP